MIQMVKGTYGRVVNGAVEAMTKHSAPFTLSEKREAELVAAGVAVKVEDPAQVEEPKLENTYANMKMAELRKVAADLGVDVTAVKSKKEVIAILMAAKAQDPETETGEG